MVVNFNVLNLIFHRLVFGRPDLSGVVIEDRIGVRFFAPGMSQRRLDNQTAFLEGSTNRNMIRLP